MPADARAPHQQQPVVTVNALPATPTITPTGSTTFCAGGSVTLTSSAGTSYLWSTGATTASISPTTSGSYSVQVTNASGCQSAPSAATVVTVNALPATPTITPTGSTTFCAGGSVTLTSSAGTTYLWSTGATTASITPTTAGSYSVKITNASSCQSVSSAATIVTVNALPATPTITPTGATTFCAGGSVTLTSSAGTTYLWSTGATTASISPTTSGSYSVQVTNASGCQSAPSAATVVTVNALPATPTITPTGSTTFCAGGSVTLTSSAGTSYLWSTGATTASISPTTSGSYSVQVTNASGCQSAPSAATVVTVNALPATPTITPTGSTTFCAGGSVTLTSSAGTTYLWSTGATTASITPTTAGSYTVKVTNASGCQSASSAATVVTVNALPATPTASVTAQPTCTVSTGIIAITAPTGMNYSIDGVTYTNTTGIFSGLAAGNYNLTAKNSSGCISGIITVTVNAQPSTPATPVASNNGPVCAGSTLTLSASTISGVTYSWAGPNGFTSSVQNPTLVYSPLYAGTYTVTATTTSGGCVSGPGSTTVSSTGIPGQWTGNISADWNNAHNWCNGVLPTSSTNVTIPASFNNPIVSSATAMAQNITIASGAILTITGQALQISGNFSSTGIINASSGSVEFNGASAQSVSGSLFSNKIINNLIVSNTGTGLSVSSTTNDTLKIAGTLSFGNKTSKINTGDNITLLSSDTATAAVGVVGPGNAILGKVVVERYVNTGSGPGQHPKSWQFLSTPTNNQTIKESWMEGNSPSGNITPGYGTQITGPGGTAAGFDMSSPAPSLKYYNNTTDTWIGVSSANNPVYNYHGYMMFVRGDRSVNGTTIKNPVPTILRTKGSLFTGTLPPITVAKDKYESIGNPYASPIDFTRITKDAGIDNKFYAWDPYLYGSYGVGGYQTLSSVNNWEPVPGGTKAYKMGVPKKTIQSGQAFLVHATAAPEQNYSLTFSENCKAIGASTSSIARPFGEAPLVKSQFFSASLFTGAGDEALIADGNTVAFDENYSNDVDGNDALKLINSGENFGLKRSAKLLAIEAKKPVEITDTIFYSMSNLRQQTYQLRFAPKNMESTGLQAFLIDKFLNNITPVSLADSSFVTITINANAASSAADRFSVIFRPMAVLPVTFVSVNAYEKSSDIEVAWKVDNESDMQQYNVEKSTDGNRFINVGKVAANNTGAAGYTWLDKNASPGYNYYRIASVSKNGKVNYTQIVKVFISKATKEFSIYPNPVINETINLQFTNQPAGIYQIRLLDHLGQVILAKTIIHTDGNGKEPISTR